MPSINHVPFTMKNEMTRRRFLGTTSTAGAGLALVGAPMAWSADTTKTPALMGGPKAHPSAFPAWPVFNETEEQALLKVLHSGAWFRGSGRAVTEFEAAYGSAMGAKHCLATSSGTAALTTALGALNIGPGDEVILPPYTFVATYNVVVLNYALPIFVDTDVETFQIDPAQIERAISPQTKALLPVHIGGSPADLDAILPLGKKHGVPVIEDACQAHLGEWRGRKLGTLGLGGCFSFQASKNLNAGEGGAVLTDEAQFAEACVNFHSQGRARQAGVAAAFDYSGTRGSNLRLTEFQGRLLAAQMTRVWDQTDRRTENARYLTALLREIPGIHPARLYEGCTRSAFHLFMFRYDPEHFAGLTRSRFLAALNAEGIPASSGYGKMNRDAYVTGLARDPHYLRVYGERRMADWLEQTLHCPQNDRLCEQAVWLTQNMLLGPRSDMDQIAEAVRKIRQHAVQLADA